MTSLHRIPLDEVDWATLDAYPDRTVFQTREWLSLLEGSLVATALSRAARARAEQHDWSAVLEQWDALLRRTAKAYAR